MISSWLRKDNHLALLLVLLVATIVRFFDVGHLGYHHDELSALLRTRFSSFSELIESGIQIDGHPAGVQFFLWVWTGIGGYGNLWVKLPFLLAGVLSVYVVYRIGMLLFGKSEGLWAAAMLASLQYGILYSQWARPYAFGLLFVLLCTWAILRIRSAPSRSDVVFLGLSIAAVAYTHYFALLQVIIVSMLSFPMLSRKAKLYLLLGSILGFLLWLPHLSVTLHQLSIGGVGDWLQKPQPDFWLQLLDFSFHYSPWLEGLLLLLVIGSIFLARKAWRKGWSVRGLLVLAVIIPYAIAYYYSMEVSALLHNGTALFAFPFLLLLVASWFRWKPVLNHVLLTIFVGLALFTLATERRHFTTNYATEYQTSLEWLNELNARVDQPIATFIDLREDMVTMLFDKQVIPRQAVQFVWPLWDGGNMVDYLAALEEEQLFVAIDAGSNPEYLAAALEYFPCIEASEHFSSGEAYLLSKRCNSLISVPGIMAVENEFLTAENPYSHTITADWGVLQSTQRNALFRASWIGETAAEVSLVFEMKNEPDPFWRAVNGDGFESKIRTKHSLYQVLYTSELTAKPSDQWKAFVWLQNKASARLMRLELLTYPSNPLKGKLFRAIDPAKP